MTESKIIFRAPRWIPLMLALLVLGTAVGSALALQNQGVDVTSVGLAIFAALALAGVIESLVTRLELDNKQLLLVAWFCRRSIPRTEIDSVTWASGVGVSIKLTDGSWIRLPALGNSQSRANSIRAWLKRTPSSDTP